MHLKRILSLTKLDENKWNSKVFYFLRTRFRWVRCILAFHCLSLQAGRSIKIFFFFIKTESVSGCIELHISIHMRTANNVRSRDSMIVVWTKLEQFLVLKKLSAKRLVNFNTEGISFWFNFYCPCYMENVWKN